mmetsp:Transcript_35515/g.85697  ORF Transcript_35515/g.85697 Transcript_35515/m.85697 type:complete len:107 (+) Transcript_35515:272-592(+)
MIGTGGNKGDPQAVEEMEDEFFDARDNLYDPPTKAREETHYSILGVLPTANVAEIRRAFRKVSITCHPDKKHDRDAGERFKRLSHAKEVLICPNRRRDYDAGLQHL